MKNRQRRIELIAQRGRAAEKARKDFYRFGVGLRWSNEDEWRRYLGEYTLRTREALPPHFEEFLKQLNAGAPDAIDYAIDFLIADPYFNTSGYVKAKIITVVKRQKLARRDIGTLLDLVLGRVRESDRAGFRYLCRLAAALQTDDFYWEVCELTRSDDHGVKRRASRLLLVCNSRRRSKATLKRASLKPSPKVV